MWNRLKRLFRSIFGGAIERAEDPELILKQTIRDMRDKVPQMQENVTQVMATERLLQKEVSTLEVEIKQYDLKVRAAIQQGRDDIAKTYITALQEKQTALERSQAQLVTAQAASKQARKFLDDYILQVKKKTAQAQQLVNEARAAKMQEQLAQTMSSFKIGDDAGTFDEMRERIQRRAAAAEARMDIATGGIDSEIADIERESLNLQVEDTLAAYKRQLGVATDTPPIPSPPAIDRDTAREKTLGPSDKAKALE
jgi:phage shock protein A